MPNHIYRVAIFSTAHRVSHWLIAGLSLFLLVSAWLIQHADVDPQAWLDWHIMLGQLLSVVLAYRIFLLFRPGSGHWRLLIPANQQWRTLLQTLRFYISLGRLPCPDWYALNPLWQPLYAIIIVILIGTTLSGYLVTGHLAPSSFSMLELHDALAKIVLYFSLSHIAVVILHDARGRGGHVSAMINGDKYFEAGNVSGQSEQHSVSIDSLLKK